MKAISVTEFGGPDVLRLVDLPSPEPGPGQVRIRVHATCVNNSDVMFRRGDLAARLADFEPPYIPGMDAAGVIDALGPDTSGRLSIGDRVVAVLQPLSSLGGGYAQQVVAPEASVVRAPSRVDFAAASTLLMNALTSRLAVDALALPPGGAIAVAGAAGAVGGYAVQLAAADGLRVIADAAPEDDELVRALGAEVVVPRGAGFAAAVRHAVPGGAPGLVDGATLDADALPAIADGGGLAVVRGWGGPTERDITIHRIWVRDALEDTAAMERLVVQVETGALTLRVADVLPFDRAVEAHRRMEVGHLRGRLVLDLS